MTEQKVLPNANAVLTMGILSLVFTFCCFFISFVGLGLGVAAVVMSNQPMKLYYQNPDDYQISSFNNLNAGRICGIISIVVAGIILLFALIRLIYIGDEFSLLFQQFTNPI